MFSVSELKVRRLQEKNWQGRILKRLLDRPTRLISTITVGNLIVNVGFSSLNTAVFVSLFGVKGLPAAVFVSGVCILLFGEVFPKTLAIYLAERIAPLAAVAMNIWYIVLRPCTLLIDSVVSYFLSFILPRLAQPHAGDAELRTAVQLGSQAGQISEDEEELINYVLEFKDTWVREIMTHRMDTQGIETAMTQEQVMVFLRYAKHSKFPVYSNSPDNISGILYAKDVFLNPETDYHTLLRPPLFVPESQRVDQLLQIFLEKKERIAIVLDEYGGTQGLVTLEDVEEEIFGEMYDEFETPSAFIEPLSAQSWRLHGRTPVKTVNFELESMLPEDQDTLAGFLLAQLGKIPHAGHRYNWRDVEFTIERASVKRIISVIAKKLPHAAGKKE